MANDYYTASNDPADNTDAEPAVLRAEHAAVEDGFDKLASLTANRIPYNNAGGNSQTTNPGFTFDGTTFVAPALVGSTATDATSATTGALKTAGGMGVAKALWVGGLANIAGAVTMQSTAAATYFISASQSLTTVIAGQGKHYGNATYGAVSQGKGSASDNTWLNDAGSVVMTNPTGTVDTMIVGIVTGQYFVSENQSLSNPGTSQGKHYGNSTYGGVSSGKGSTSDNTWLNKNGSVVLSNPTGTVNVEISGGLSTSGTVTGTYFLSASQALSNPSAGQGKRYGNDSYGAVQAGSGSISDNTWLHKTGGLVMSNPTGTTNVEIVGTLLTGGALTTNGGLQTFGANDSGGSGKRLVLVPNA